MIKHKYKIRGKPLYSWKQKELFEMFDIWLECQGKFENENWRILGKEHKEISVKNKHTFETFEFIILDY